MRENYSIEWDELKSYVDWVIKQGATGIAVNVDTGEGPYLTSEERMRIIQATKEVADGRCHVIAGVGGPATMTAIQNAKEAGKAGADALLIFPTPAFLNDPLDAKIIYSYHKEIAEASRAPIIVFQLGPIFGGVNYPTHALEKVLELPQVIGLKDASFDALRFSQTRDIVQSANHPITLLNGNDNFLLESFLLGAKGGLLGFGAVGVRLLVDMLNCVKNHKYEQAAAMQKKVQGFCDYIYEQPIGDYRARCKVALVHMGLFKKEHTYVRPPFLSLWAAEQNRAYQAVEQVGLLNCV